MKLAALAEAYVAHLQAAGKSPSTCATTKRTLALLVAHLGAEREAAEVAEQDLEGFFASDVATKLDGRPRAQATVAQIQRIVRAACAWAREQKGKTARVPITREPPALAAHATQPPTPATPRPSATRTSQLDLTFKGQPVRFSKCEIDRARLYGVRKLVALDAQGHECQTALLTHDGRFVLRPGSTAELYIDDRGDTVARRDLVLGTEATTSEDHEITGPVAAPLDFVVTRVYALEPISVPVNLARALAAGEVFRVPYRSRASAIEMPAFLLGSEAGAFLLLVEPHGFDFIGPDQPTVLADDPAEDNPFAFPDSFAP